MKYLIPVIMCISYAVSPVALAKKKDMSSVELDRSGVVDKKLKCLKGLQDDSFLIQRSTEGQRLHELGISSNCYFCGSKGPALTKTMLWNKDENTDVLVVFEQSGKGSKAKFVEFPKLRLSTDAPSKAARQVCLVDKKGHKLAPALTLFQANRYAIDNDPVMSVGCGPQQSREKGQNAKYKSYTNDLVTARILEGAEAEQLATQFKNSIDSQTKEAVSKINLRNIQSAVEKNTEWRADFRKASSSRKDTTGISAFIPPKKVGNEFCDEVLDQAQKTDLYFVNHNLENFRSWAQEREKIAELDGRCIGSRGQRKGSETCQQKPQYKQAPSAVGVTGTSMGVESGKPGAQ